MAACDSIKHEHSGTINEVLQLDGESISKYFFASCKQQLPVEATEEMVQYCADTKTGEFLEFMMNFQQSAQ